MASLLHALNDDLASVVEDAQHSLVVVRSAATGAGAGTIWHPDGLIVTSGHVIQRTPISVMLPDGLELLARLLAHDPGRDLAALSIEARDLPAIPLGESRTLRPGQWVLALGHPWGVRGSVTAGTVIGSGSEWPEPPMDGRDWIVVGLHYRPGYSGGPLLDVQGRLVGINTMMMGPGVGAAVPVHVAKEFLKQAFAAVDAA